jgi:hypothetical protein
MRLWDGFLQMESTPMKQKKPGMVQKQPFQGNNEEP